MTGTAPALPSPDLLKESNEALREMQVILGNLGKDERRNDPEFQEIMQIYKAVGTALHQARKRLPPPPPPGKKPAQAGTYGPTALGRPRSATGALGTSAPGRGLQPAGAKAIARPAPLAAGTEPGESAAEPLPATLAAEPPAPPVVPELPPPPTIDQPLALPKFAATLGPPGSKAIDKGPPVANLQQLLFALGHLVDASGTYDGKTFRAVQEFQLARRIPVNGLVGLDTRRQLNELVTG